MKAPLSPNPFLQRTQWAAAFCGVLLSYAQAGADPSHDPAAGTRAANPDAYAAAPPARLQVPRLPNLSRQVTLQGGPPAGRHKALAALQKKVPGVEVQFDPILGSPNHLMARGRFLAEAPAHAADAHAPVKQFLDEHAALFGHNATVLKTSRLTRDDVAPGSGMRTVVWQQELDGIPIYQTMLKANLSRTGALVALGSSFMTDAAAVARSPLGARAALIARPPVDAVKAVSLAAEDLGDKVAPSLVMATSPVQGAERSQRLTAPLLSDTAVKLSWLPISADTTRLVWDVTLMSLQRREMFRILVDTTTGDILLRNSLTVDISNASYRVFAHPTTFQPFDSPSPFSPGLSTPGNSQPPTVTRNLLTTPALNTTASPNGWIDDGGTQTYGNNVDAHLDLADTNPEYGSGTHAQSPTRIFDFTLNLAQSPQNYQSAAITQLFYVCNWYHDQLYALGFTESCGNFQQNNFGRGGLGNDAVLADAQDGGDVNNANFSTPPDGYPGRMQMYLFSQSTPYRDGDLDAEVVIHELTHGLSNRLVGGGTGLYTHQAWGLGEGWSDFYSLCLLSEPGDAINGNYASGAYVSYLLGDLTENYYYGIRRYPYSTDMTKNPLTLKDIDPTQASPHSGVPRSPIIWPGADEVHNMGEVWCATLWDARANLISKHGATTGNPLILQLVTDGMKLSPANPTYLQARDAIIQADLVANAGANRTELWAAFAKRGMGVAASVPASTSVKGVVESYDMPDNLAVTPNTICDASGTFGGPFTPSSQVYALTNNGTDPLNWSATTDQPWLAVSPLSGTLAAGASTTATVTITGYANSVNIGTYTGIAAFTNLTSGATLPRKTELTISPPRVAYFDFNTDPGWARQGEWAFGNPTGSGGDYFGYPDPAHGATGSNVFGINLDGDYGISFGRQYLTSGPINLMNRANTQLRFKRWLNTDYLPYVLATVEVSNDGSNWNTVFSNDWWFEIADSGWTTVQYDISALADGYGTLYVRWGHEVWSEFAFPYAGWNIDDVEILAIEETGPPLAVIPVAQNASASSASYQFKVVANTSWSWSSNVAWLRCNEASPQNGNAMFSYNVGTNTSTTERTGLITLTNGERTVIYTVTQAGAMPGEFENTLIQLLDDERTESTWQTGGYNSLYEASLATPTSFQSDAFDGVGTTAVHARSAFATVTATDVWTNQAIPAQRGNFAVTFRTVPSSNSVDTVIGLSPTTADFWDDLAVSVRFSAQGKIEARNGSAYAAVSDLSYAASTIYLVEMQVNVATKRYSMTVTPAGGSPVVIASDFAFRTEQNSVTRLANFACLTSAGGTQTVSDLVVPALGAVTATTVWGNHPLPEYDKRVFASFRTTPSGGAMDAAFGFSSAPAAIWSDLAAAIRFNNQGKVDARNGNAYTAQAVFPYAAGVTYRINMEIDVKARRYWATVTPLTPGGSPVLIAENYAFRTEQNAVTYLSNFSYSAAAGGTQAVAGLVVSDFGTATTTHDWTNREISPQSGSFSASFITTPNSASVDTVIGFSSAAVDFWDDMAAYVRFNSAGMIDARNGSNFSAAQPLNYVAGVSYLVEMEVNVVTRRYSATVTPAGGAPTRIAYNYVFRTEQNGVSQLANFAFLTWTGGTQSLTALVITNDGIELPALTAADSSGPLTATATAGGIGVTKEIRLVPGCHATDDMLTVANLTHGIQQVTLQLMDNYGSDWMMVVHLTSSGDTVVGPDDHWFISNDVTNPATNSSDPTLLVSWQESANLPDPVFWQVPHSTADCLQLSYVLTLAAGESATITFRRQLFTSAEEAVAFGLPLGDSNADLAGLTINAASLAPAFNASITNYSASVAATVEAVTITPVVAQSGATVAVAGIPVSSGSASAPITLNPGTNMISTVVTAGNGLTKKSYAVEITRTSTSIQAWRLAWFGNVSNTGNAADDFDFDHDGLVNVLEFAFGSNPTVAGPNPIPQPQLSDGNLLISFTTPPGVDGVAYGAEWSATLAAGDWHVITDTGTGNQHSFSVPIAGQARLFVRQKVSVQD
jgi:hypothetical protein